MYDLDFAIIKQGCAHRRPPPLPKNKGKGSKGKEKGKSVDSNALKLGATLKNTKPEHDPKLSKTVTALSTGMDSTSKSDLILPLVGDSPTQNKQTVPSEDQSLPHDTTEKDKNAQDDSNTELEDFVGVQNIDYTLTNADKTQPTSDIRNTGSED